MFIPELLYKFTRPKDLVQQQLQVFQRAQSISTASAQVTLQVYNNTEDEVLVLSNATAGAFAGGSNIIQNIKLYFTSTNGGIGFFAQKQVARFDITTPAFSEDEQNNFINWTGELWLLPGAQVGVQGNFNGGGNVHTLQCYMQGIKIPRANVTAQ